MPRLRLSFACCRYDRMEAIREGNVGVEGVDLTCITLKSGRDVFDRMVGGQEFDIALSEFDIAVAEFVCIGARAIDHRRCEIDADDMAGCTGFSTGYKAIISCAAAEIDHDVPLFDLGKFSGQPATEAEIGIWSIAFELAVVIGHDVVHISSAAAGATACSFVVSG